MPNKPKPRTVAKNGRAVTKAPADMERVQQPHGGALLTAGVKGNAGGGQSDKAFMLSILRDPDARDAFKAVAKDKANPQAVIAARRFAREVVFGKPKQEVQHGGSVTLTHEARDKRIAEILATVGQR